LVGVKIAAAHLFRFWHRAGKPGCQSGVLVGSVLVSARIAVEALYLNIPIAIGAASLGWLVGSSYGQIVPTWASRPDDSSGGDAAKRAWDVKSEWALSG
jgi:hypothetical protein